MRKFRCAAHAAEGGIDGCEKPTGPVVEGGVVEGSGVALGVAWLEARAQGIGIGTDAVWLLMKRVGDGLQHVDESGAPIALVLREIGPAPEGLRARCQEHRQGPAALLADEMKRVHIDRVHVRPFLAIDLDIHEQLVHDRGRVRVLEALMGHDMAPMTRGVADGQKDGLSGFLRLGEGRRAPGTPMDRIVLVLPEIGARFLGEVISVLFCHPGFQSS